MDRLLFGKRAADERLLETFLRRMELKQDIAELCTYQADQQQAKTTF